MSLIPAEIVLQVTEANDIVEVLAEYFPLKQAGPVYEAHCPLHDERNALLTVEPHRQIYKCFACGAGGSVIRFVMKYENLDFIGATKKLAQRAGIKID